MGFKCEYQGLLLPLGRDAEMEWPNAIRLILYLMGLGWMFLGVAVISDVFMNGIEKITSSKKRVKNKDTGRMVTVYVWNDTVANLTLMALGSSAPEILLSLIEIMQDEFFLGPLGAGTIVGSAAFNLLVISAVCVAAIPDGEVRYIKQVSVYVVTSTCSVFAYLWLMFILMFSSPDVCELWEALVTLLMCPALVIVAYLADRGYLSRKQGTDYVEQDDHHETIPDDVTDEQLAEIEKEIRKQHGENLTHEQVVKIMRVTYFHKHSRAWYRHQAMQAKLKGHHVETKAEVAPEFAIQEVLNTSDDIKQEKLKKMAVIGFASCKYAYKEDVGKAKVQLFREGAKDCKVSVKYATKEGTAKPETDYDHVESTVTFEKGETEKDIFIAIRDDTSFEKDEEFYVNLSDPSCEESSGFQAQLSKYNTTTVVIIDDDQPGELRFETEEVECSPEAGGTTINVLVQRYNGGNGKISCSYNTDNMTAVDGVDFEGAKGTLEFESGQQTATIPVVLNSRSRTAPVNFNVVIKEPNGTTFDPKTDGGEESCICHVTLPAGTGAKDMFAAMKERVHSANAIMGHKNWADQFRAALFEVGDGDDDEAEDGDEPTVKEGPSKVDYFMHFLSVPWKLLFAFVPPVDYCGGWACFCGALCMIAVVTALVGDMANLVGCCMDIYPEDNAITFVALGTSLPDTFASQTAAKMDPYADASIGNIVGSNSINVFMGIGIAWTLAAFKWTIGGQTAEWRTRVLKLTASEIENVGKVVSGDSGVFVTPGGTIWFNLVVFSVNALCAIQHLFARRKRWGGELGGPKKGFMGQYFSAGFLVSQWFIYIGASIVFTHLNDGLSYGQLNAA